MKDRRTGTGPRAAALALVLVAGGASGAAAATLTPHRAAYELALVPTTEGELVDLRGALVIEWEATCDLWLSHQRMAFDAVQMNGERFRHDVRYGSAEGTGSETLRFTVRRFDGDDLVEEYRGDAELEARAGGVASFETPAEERVELPAGTVFPTAHLQDVLARAEAGEGLVTHLVFDGWGYDALTQVTTVIGERQARTATDDDPAEAGWPVSMAYYATDGESDLPTFEATFLLSSNGVLHDLELDYGDFAVAAALSEVELHDRPGC